MTFEDRYSTASQPFPAWVLGQLDPRDIRSAADVGCGQGRFTLLLARCLRAACDEPGQLEVVALDRDGAALAYLQDVVGRNGLPVRTLQGEACDRSVFVDASQDVVMINLLLHLLPPPDVKRVIENARAWLRPEGQLVISGYGWQHMSATYSWLREALVACGQRPEAAEQIADRRRRTVSPRSFLVEDGIRHLSRAFDSITYRRFDDVLQVPVEDLIQLTLPSLIPSRRQLDEMSLRADALVQTLTAVMHGAAVDGLLSVPTDLGMLVATCSTADGRV